MACSGTGKQLRRAESYMEDGRYKSAARTYEGVLEHKPDHAEALVGAASAWALAGETERAIERAEEARSRALPGADLALARALITVGRGAEARQLLSASDPAQARLLAEAHLAAGDLEAAWEVAQQAGPAPEDAVLAAWIRWRVHGAEDCAEALSQARKAAERAYEDPLVLGDAAAVLSACDQAEDSARLARDARTFHLDGSAPFHDAAALRADGGDFEGAARLLARAAALYPDEGQLSRDLGVMWLETNEPRLAADELLRALPLDPYDQDVERHQTVIGGFGMEADERTEQCHDLWATLALALERVGAARNAAAAQQRALLLDPAADGAAWGDLALEWSKVGDFSQAEAAGRRAIQLDGADARLWLVMADISFNSGQMQESAGFASRAWDLDPGDPAIAVRLAEASLGAGAPREALRVLETAIRELHGAVHPLSGKLHALLAEASQAAGD